MHAITRKAKSRAKCVGIIDWQFPLFTERCTERGEWQLSPESHRWCLHHALRMIDRCRPGMRCALAIAWEPDWLTHEKSLFPEGTQ